MKRLHLHIICFALMLLPSLAYSDFSEDYFECMGNIDYGAFKNTQMMVCVTAEIERQDVVLNREYQKLRRSLSQSQNSALVQAQRSWLGFRENWCRFEEMTDFAPGGELNYKYCILSTTRDQINRIISQQF